MTPLSAALRYLKAGYAVIPVWRDARKNPHLTSYSEYTENLPSVDDWRRWASQWPKANIGLITGYWGLVGLDFDDVASYETWCSLEGPGYGVAGMTWTVRTRRGYHVWFRVLADPGSSRMYVNGQHEVLLRAKGGYCIVPPSIHHTGYRYQTVHKVEPLTIDRIEPYLDGWQEKKNSKKQLGVKPAIVDKMSMNFRIEDLVPPLGKPNARGAHLAVCPFHDDSHPSAWVNVTEQRFGCNACWPGKWWDVINVYSMLNGISNGEAWLKARRQNETK